MLLGTDELTILRGSKFYGTWQWINSVTGDAEDFAGLTASVKIKNIHEDFENAKNTYEVGTATVEPLDINQNAFKGRVDIELSKEETLLFAIPEGEDDRYGESDFYAILEILLSTGEVILQAKVRVIESLESETLNFLLDEKDEAIIINGKLDNILLRNNEYVSTRDNLIDVVIPTALLTYNTNHDEKMDIYNANYTNKLDTYNSNDTSKTNTYNQNHESKLQEVNTLALNVQSNKDLVDLAKANVLTMKDDVQGNKESVALMKTAIETMLDNFDDRFLGPKDSDPILDNDGNPLQIAAIYYNNLSKELRFYNGTSWDSPVAAAQTYALQASQSASDALASKNAAKLSEDNAKFSELNAQNLANQVANNYEPKNANVQSHISNNSNPHGVTASQVGAYSISESDTIYNQKVNISDIQNTLLSIDTNKPLSALQGKVLKDLIDNIMLLLSSDNTALDSIQEIVDLLEINRDTLALLGISNITGLVDALAAKVNIADVYNKTELDLKISYQQFDKPSKGPLFIKVSPSSIKITAGLKLTVGTTSFKVITDYTLTLASDLVGSTKAAGTDYFVYAKADATFYISADDTITTDRLIGGFHYGLVGETEAPSGEKTEEMMVRQRGIWAASCWDLKKRPSSKSPRAKNFAFGIWADIYPADEDIAIRGYSSPWKDPYATTRVKAKLAGGTTEFGRGIPKIPLAFKGNGTLTYGKLNHWDACEIAASLDMSLLSLAEFSLLAKGVLENVSSLTNAYETTMGTIEHYPNLTSEYLEQATGVQWMWSSNLATSPTDTTWAWRAVTGGRGQIYSTESSPIAVLLGGNHDYGVYAGSRASNWLNSIWNSYWSVGCRFACRDLELV